MTDADRERPALIAPFLALKLRVYRFVRRRVASYFALSTRQHTNADVSNVRIDAAVVLYFADEPARLYQVQQWLPVLEKLDERHRVVLLVRNQQSFQALRDQSPLSVVFLRRLGDLNGFFASNDFKLVLYVNNSALNFHSLLFSTVLHMHLNHGESDKVSMASNQAKAYDRVVVAGQAAIDRYRSNLIEFDGRNLVPVGRPQLDVAHPSALPHSDRLTVLYAPTWQGERDEMNYTSLDVYGPTIVEQLLDAGDYRVVYKPHPRVAEPESLTAAAHAEVVAAIQRAAQRDPSAGHRVEMDAAIASLFHHSDAMVCDVSSVGLDFLYLATDKPLLLTDRANDLATLEAAAPVTTGAYVVNAANVRRVAALVGEALRHDSKQEARHAARRYYFGDLGPGESTQRFLAAVEDAIAVRDAAVQQRHRPMQPVSDTATGSA